MNESELKVYEYLKKNKIDEVLIPAIMGNMVLEKSSISDTPKKIKIKTEEIKNSGMVMIKVTKDGKTLNYPVLEENAEYVRRWLTEYGDELFDREKPNFSDRVEITKPKLPDDLPPLFTADCYANRELMKQYIEAWISYLERREQDADNSSTNTDE